MNRLAALTTLSARLDNTLNEFALTANEAGQMPWEAAQEKKRNRRLMAGAVGAAAIGAGAYGAKKGMGALNKRYGTTGTDGLKVGAADMINRADDAVKGGVAKMKAAAAPVMGAVKRKWNAGKLSYSRGMAQKQGLGKMVGRVARAVVHASRADQIIALEAKMDAALEFAGKSKDVGGGYSSLREEREYDPETSTLRKRLALDKKPGAKEHLKRNAANYVGAAGGLVGGRYAAGKLSGVLKGRLMGGKKLAGLSPKGKVYAAAVAGGLGSSVGDKIDKGRANARIYEKLVKEGRIDAVNIGKATEDPRTDLPKSVVTWDRAMFKAKR